MCEWIGARQAAGIQRLARRRRVVSDSKIEVPELHYKHSVSREAGDRFGEESFINHSPWRQPNRSPRGDVAGTVFGRICNKSEARKIDDVMYWPIWLTYLGFEREGENLIAYLSR